MKKDIVIAISVGFATGALVAVIALNFPYILSAVRKTVPDTKSPLASPSVSLVPTSKPVLLSVAKPQENLISQDKNITVDGNTEKDNIVVVENGLDQDIMQASPDGSFSFPLTLSIGSNDITITAYNKNEESISKTITVLYQEEQL